MRQKLLKQRPDGIDTESGERALHLAAMQGHFAAVRRLVGWFAAHGIDVVAPGKDGISPLHLAAGSGKQSMVQLLIKVFGADPTAPNGVGQTPLHCAARSGNDDLALWLYERWPEKPSAHDEMGDTLLHAAA